MNITSSEAHELTPGSIRWDDTQDATLLCQSLLELSAVDQGALWGNEYWVDQEKIRGLALFLRASLPYEAARPKEARQQLLDLTYSGNNRAWLASLCASLPFDDVKQQIASFCNERLKAGSKHRWEKVLAQIPGKITEPIADYP
ncbi:MAG: hypothetical protein WCO51_04955 [bacterium]